MSTPPKPRDITTPVIIAVGVLLAGGICAYYFLSKNSQATTRATLADVRALETRLRDLEKSLADLKAKQARMEPRAPVAPATDPVLVSQMNALTAALTSMAESQKAQQAAVAQLNAKLSQPAPVAVPAATTPPPSATTAAPLPKPAPATLNAVEAAYKQAFETDKPVVIGQVRNPQTGQMEGGRTIDPAQARTLGMATWAEWYATAEKARRAELEAQAGSELNQLENTLVDIPKKQKP